MLTFKYRNVLPLKNIVSAQIVTYFWDAAFMSEKFINKWKPNWETPLRNHRDKTVSISNVFIEENKLPLCFQSIFKESIFSLYQAYRQMFLWEYTYDPKGKIALLKVGELYAPNYFTVNGEFNDFLWAKCFVNDSSNDIYCRFYLACFYWFEDETKELWTKLKISNSAPYAGNLVDIREQMNPLITLRIFYLENKLDTLLQEELYQGNFWEVGLEKAARRGYEYATYYFWQNLGEEQRIRMTESDSFFGLMSGFIDYPDDKVSFFLYSKLSNKRKENLVNWTITHNKPKLWLTLLLSPNSQEIRKELLELIYKLPIKMYSYLLEILSGRIKEIQLTFEMEIFQVLWNNLTPEVTHYTLKKFSITKNLIYETSFYNLGYIIKGLSLEQKEKCLLNGWYWTWDCIFILLAEDDLDLLQTFLTFFLIELDSQTQKQSLLKDANLLLQTFNDSYFISPRQEDMLEDEKEEFINIISRLQVNITLLDELCYRVCKEICTSSDLKRRGGVKVKTSELHNASLSPKRKYEEWETKTTKIFKSSF